MTLVLSVVSPESLWTVADRRLTTRTGVYRDNARKIMFLESGTDLAILAYAGLGATAQGTEPSDWMSAVLRGRNWSIEQSLEALAQALKRELPPHLARLPTQDGPSHNVLVATFINEEPRIYTIDFALSPDRTGSAFRHTRWVTSTDVIPYRTPRFAIAGSAIEVLSRERSWRRPLLTLVRAYDDKRISARSVADALAALNLRASRAIANGTVGPHCIVAWRNRRAGVHKGGGGHQYYSGTIRDRNNPSLPTIAGGMDLHALFNAMMPHMFRPDGKMEFDIEAMTAEISSLPDSPDERLR